MESLDVEDGAVLFQKNLAPSWDGAEEAASTGVGKPLLAPLRQQGPTTLWARGPVLALTALGRCGAPFTTQ